jgi:inward rectifier potassium channel
MASGRRFVRHGLPGRRWQDLYHFYMTISWPRLFVSFAAFLMAFNLLFAAVYWLHQGGIANLNPPGFWGCFFFSVETLATVGYGDMHPQTLFAHIIASVEIFTGMMSLAVIAGMMFARFSRPTARILFARYAVIRPLDGEPTLMLRAANERGNVIMEAQARLRLVREERTVEGYRIRRIHDLPLRRAEQPAFLLGWTLLHTLGPDSPLAGATRESLQARNAFLILTLSGIDETTGQTLMARHEYPPETLHWQHTFVDILSTGEDGAEHIDYTKFHDVVPLE